MKAEYEFVKVPESVFRCSSDATETLTTTVKISIPVKLAARVGIDLAERIVNSGLAGIVNRLNNEGD